MYISDWESPQSFGNLIHQRYKMKLVYANAWTSFEYRYNLNYENLTLLFQGCK